MLIGSNNPFGVTKSALIIESVRGFVQRTQAQKEKGHASASLKNFFQAGKHDYEGCLTPCPCIFFTRSVTSSAKCWTYSCTSDRGSRSVSVISGVMSMPKDNPLAVSVPCEAK